MGHEDRRRADVCEESAHFGAHIDPQRGIEGGERLIEQHQRWRGSKCSSESDSLLLTAR